MSIPRLDEDDFARLRDAASVKKRLRFMTPEHWRACGCYLALLPVLLLFAGYGGYALERAGLTSQPWVVLVLLVLAALLPLLPLLRVRRHVRRPILDEFAEQQKLDYASHDFELKPVETARPILFGENSSATLTDLLAGKGGDQWAICQAEIEADGESAYSGLIYWFKRKGDSTTILLVPASVAGRVKAPKKARPLPFPQDPKFAAAFVIHASDAARAEALFDEAFRAALLSHAEHGPVFLHLAGDNAIVAVRSPESFESDEDRRLSHEGRLRAIFDKVAAAFANGSALKAHLG